MARFDERTFSGMRLYISIVQTGSFASAATQNHISPSGVSRAISRLESRLGIRLFDRTTRSLSVTEEGLKYYERILPLLTELEEATEQLNVESGIVKGKLRVNIDPFFSALILGPKLEFFMKEHPELSLELVTSTQDVDIVSEGYDLSVRFGPPENSSFNARKLLETRILTVASPAYLSERPVSDLHPTSLSDSHHEFIEFRNPKTGKPFIWEFHKGKEIIHVNTNGKLIVNDVATMLNTCIAGFGIAQVMEISAKESIDKGKLKVIYNEWSDETFPLYAVYPSSNFMPIKSRRFLDFVVDLTNVKKK